MTAEDLRADIKELLEEELVLDVQIQGKRLIVEDGGQRYVILVTPINEQPTE